MAESIESLSLGDNIIKKCGVTDIGVKEFHFTWIIKHFSKCYKDVGFYFESPQFTTGDKDEYTWTLDLYPNGYNTQCQDYLSVRPYLCNKNSSPLESVYILLSLVNRQGKEIVCQTLFAKKNELHDDKAIFKQFVKRDFVLNERNGLRPNDELTIICKMHFKRDINSYIIPIKPAIKEISTDCRLTQFNDFEKLLELGTFSDVKLVVDDKEFHVHKNILTARSRVFSAMFEHDMRERNDSIVQISDVTSKIMEEVLRFIYAGKVNNIEAMAGDLLAAAEKYELVGLKVTCEKILIDDLSVDNIGEMLVLVDKYNADNLRVAGIEFVTNHIKELSESEHFQLIIKSLSSPLLSSVINILMLKF